MLREQFRVFIFPLTFALSKAPESTPTGIPFDNIMMIKKIIFIGRLYCMYDRWESREIYHLPCILQDDERNEYLTVLHGEDAIMPWHVGDEVMCDMSFRVEERYGRAYPEIVVKRIMRLDDYCDEVMLGKGGKR